MRALLRRASSTAALSMLILGAMMPISVSALAEESAGAEQAPRGNDEKTAGTTGNQGAEKILVCKFVGTPGVDERLKPGTNPIEVSVNSLPKDVVNAIGARWGDAQDGSRIVAAGSTEADCLALVDNGPDLILTLAKVWTLNTVVQAGQPPEATGTPTFAVTVGTGDAAATTNNLPVGATVTLPAGHTVTAVTETGVTAADGCTFATTWDETASELVVTNALTCDDGNGGGDGDGTDLTITKVWTLNTVVQAGQPPEATGTPTFAVTVGTGDAATTTNDLQIGATVTVPADGRVTAVSETGVTAADGCTIATTWEETAAELAVTNALTCDTGNGGGDDDEGGEPGIVPVVPPVAVPTLDAFGDEICPTLLDPRMDITIDGPQAGASGTMVLTDGITESRTRTVRAGQRVTLWPTYGDGTVWQIVDVSVTFGGLTESFTLRYDEIAADCEEVLPTDPIDQEPQPEPTRPVDPPVQGTEPDAPPKQPTGDNTKPDEVLGVAYDRTLPRTGGSVPVLFVGALTSLGLGGLVLRRRGTDG